MSKALEPIDSFLSRWTFCWILVLLAAISFSIALMEISFVMTLVGWVLLRTRRPVTPFFARKMFWPLLGFVFLSVVSFFWSEFPAQSLRGIFKVLKHFFLFWIVIETLNTPKRQSIAWGVLTAVVLLLSLNGMWQYVFGFDFLRHIPYEAASSGPRISASFKNYGLLASFILSFLPVLFSRPEGKRGWISSFASALAVTLGILLLFWSRSRGAWLASVGGMVFYLFFTRKKIYLTFFFAAILAGAFLLPRSMLIHLDADGKEQSLVERLYLWDRAVEVIQARPWTGTGINTYSVAHQKYDKRQNWRVRNYYAHNGYLQIAAETGLPSLGFFLAFLLLYFKEGIRSLGAPRDEIYKKFLVGTLTGVLNFLILASIDTIFHNPSAVMGFWFLAGWGIAYQRVAFSRPDQRA